MGIGISERFLFQVFMEIRNSEFSPEFFSVIRD